VSPPENRPAAVNPLVVRALKIVGQGSGRRALDVGPGDLSNTRYLLDHGMAVDVVDRNPAVVDEAAALDHSRVRAFCADIRRFVIEPERYHIVVALTVSKVLPPHAIWSMLAAARTGMVDEGVLCCTLLGNRDSWARPGPPATSFTKTECERLVSDWPGARLKEIEFDGKDRRGADKHWHWYALLLSRR
jgi:hypothetical protein